ncbi:Bug family tripartite tricarboxylate transporter substrate binding protein [Pigmentiphaga aceris]|nr:tripartite tricarboxylate transporter substrate binding protein [Pigmentiphaga aceris]
MTSRLSHPVNRRRFLQIAAASTAALALPSLARAAAYPDRPIRLVVPSAPGGSPDAICRILGEALGRAMGQAVIIDNKPGASGNIGMSDISRAAPDGYTLGYANVGTLSINRALFSKLPYDPDVLVPVSLLGFVQNALVVRKDLPASNVMELIALAKAKPGTLTIGSAGNGTTGHLGGELFKSLTKTEMVHVPYRGSAQAIQDLMGGQLDLMFDNLSSVAPHIKGDRVRVLGVSGAARNPLFPDIPTIAEAGVPGYETVAWGGVVAPPGTPATLVAQINDAINTQLQTPAVSKRYESLGFEVLIGPPSRLSELATKETPIWAEMVKRSGAKID